LVPNSNDVCTHTHTHTHTLAQMKRIHCKEKQHSKPPKARGAPPHAQNLNWWNPFRVHHNTT
jgi:hypothetical protein